MSNEDKIIQMLRDLSASGINSTYEFYKDIVSLVKTNVNEFVETFSKDIKLPNIDEYNKFEYFRQESRKYKKELDGNNLYRYEYRKDKKNIKCFFIIENEDGERLLLSAFKEDGGKEFGSNSYKSNIPRAVRIYEKYKNLSKRGDEK